MLLFARRYPVQAMMAVTAVTALVAAIVVCLLLRASRQRAKMQAVHNRQLSQALQIARDANEAKTTFLSNMSHDIPIFAMTANTFASDRRRCREAGMNGYIPKPVSVKNIEEALTVIEK